MARFNIARADQGKEVDVRYIARLGADAAPALVAYLARERVVRSCGLGRPQHSMSANHAVTTPAGSLLDRPTARARPPTTGSDVEAARRLLRDWGPGHSNGLAELDGQQLARPARRRVERSVAAAAGGA